MSILGIADAVVAPLIRRLVDAGRPESDAVSPSLDGAAIADRFARAAWSCVAEPGDGIAGLLVRALGPVDALAMVVARREPADVVAALADAGEQVGGGSDEQDREEIAAALARWMPRLNSATVVRVLEQSRRLGLGIAVPRDEDWPEGFADLGDHAPVALWLRGNRASLARLDRGIAIVGARAATGYGEHVAIELSAALAARGYTVVSGAAYGIDGAAHRAALSAHGETIAFLAGGLDRFYPSGHEELISRIVERSVVLSEVPVGTAPTRWRFLTRNRLIASAAQATVVVEAGWRSGSINTARHAIELGRPVGVIPGPVTSASSAGCHRILREWPSTLVTSADDVAELAPLAAVTDESEGASAPGVDAERGDAARSQGRHQSNGRSARPDAEATRMRLLDALSDHRPRDADRIAALSGLALDRVRAELGLLELDGTVRRHAAGWTRLVTRG